jgi:tRNA U38,U39,U40 pseudouridine synthase TruA
LTYDAASGDSNWYWLSVLNRLFSILRHGLLCIKVRNFQDHPYMQVSREFHPNFAAKWRYLYIFPLDDDGNLRLGGEQSSKILQNSEDSIIPQSIDVAQLDKIIRQLMGKTLSYRMFARDTQASRSV